MNNPLISIIIPAYNCQKTIKQCLSAVFAQTYNSVEVIVVDDGSTDDSAGFIKSFNDVNYVYQENAGPAAARNAGVKIAKGEVVFFTDSDCIPHADWVALVMKGFEDSAVGAVAGSYGIANKEVLLARCVYDEIMFRHKRLPPYPKVFGSYNVAIRKEVFNFLGGFSCHYRQASGEDNDLSYRLLKAGHKIFFESGALVDHFHPVSVLKYLKEQFRHGFWRAPMLLAHPQLAKADDYTCLKDVVEVPLSVLIVLFGLLSFVSGYGELLFHLCLILLLTIEFKNAFAITKNIVYAVFYAFIMLLRSFARAWGLMSGLINYYINYTTKKS